MSRALIRLLITMLVTLLIVALISFCLLALSPVDPVNAYLGYGKTLVSEEQKLLIMQQWQLDQPFYRRFFTWLWGFVRGEWGWSLTFNSPVIGVMVERISLSLPLIASAWCFSTVLGLALGVAAGVRHGRMTDRVTCFLSWFHAAMPGYWVAMLLLLCFALRWPLLPAGGVVPPGSLEQTVDNLTALKYRVLPVAALTLTALPAVILHAREKVVSLMLSKTVQYARAQGAGRWDIAFYHGLPHAAIPVLTFQLAALGELLGGAVLIEQVFAWPGLGQATVQAGLYSDIPLLMAIALSTSIVVCLGNGMADWISRTLDARVVTGGSV